MTIHSGWAFSENEINKRDDNIAHLAALKLVRGTDYTMQAVPGYAHFKYTLVALSDKAKELTTVEAALVADCGNLCFGGGDFNKNDDVYTGIIHTD